MSMGSWRRFNRDSVETEKDMGGVYEFGNASRVVVYIGSSGKIKNRLLYHLRAGDASIDTHAIYYRVDYRLSYRTEERRRYDAYVALRRSGPLCNDLRSQ